MKKCLCGCGINIISPDKEGRERFYKQGHNPSGLLTRFQKDKHSSFATEFKKGRFPWNKNKGVTSSICPTCNNKKSHMAQICRKCWFKENPPWNRGKIGVQKGLKGDKNPMWNGGTTPLRNQIYNSTEYKLWSSKIKKRDDFCCKQCSHIGGILHTDHIKPFFLILRENKIKSLQDAIHCDELWDINNGRTLCVVCHKLTPTYGNKLYFRLLKGIESCQ